MSYIIYGLYCECQTCTPEVKYVGQTVRNLESRINAHLNNRAISLVSNWVHQHGSKHIKYKVLEEGEDEEQKDDRERYWIAQCKTFGGWGQGGVNSDKGGGVHNLDEEEKQFLRWTHGKTHRKKKLTWGDAIEIRRLYSETNTPVAEIATRFGVVEGTVYSVVMNYTWHDPDYTYNRRSKKGVQFKKKTDKLTEEIVREIREIYVSRDVSIEELAITYGVAPNTLVRVVRNRTWVDESYTPPPAWSTNIYTQRRNFSLTQAEADEIRERYSAGGVTQSQLATEFKVHQATISGIVTGKSYKPHGMRELDDR